MIFQSRPKTAVPTPGNAPLIGGSNNKSGKVKVFVGNLPYDALETDILDFFQENRFSPSEAKLFFDDQGNSKGCGIVLFGSQADADEAIECMNSRHFKDKKITVKMSIN
mmetsp:Transcript_12754/g.21521  ORF Transcript_12754/g.21521 Transcript_12754/m.21521 type:complete len:109 (+) Transcript_12754:2362-2688(+)